MEHNSTTDNSVPSPETDVIDDLQKQLGGYGRYQMLIYVLIGIVYMRGGWQLWIPAFQVELMSSIPQINP